jgi:light-regulated signal transduction histidine kinase (bacteriophytochrome)
MSTAPKDLTLQSLRQENERLEQALAQANAELEDFTYSVSHDLKASLRHVNAYVQIIEEDLGEQASDDIAAHLKVVSNAARTMAQQIDGLAALSRLSRASLNLTAVDLAELIPDVVASLAPALAERTLAWHVATDLPPVRADAALTQEVLEHLLSNAIKFTARRPLATVDITWQVTDDGFCIVTVSDNGVGFNPLYTAKLFHPFQRLHTTREFEGLGIGLALTRKIIERHGGTVSAQGEVGVGARVSFTLPLATAKP